MDYFQIIHCYIPPDSKTYPLYLIHCTLVAKMALAIGERLGLGTDTLRFVEEAAMLHDIGIAQTNLPIIFCSGPYPYLHHLTEGCTLLEQAGLPTHARVALTHAGLSLTEERLIENGIEQPLAAMRPKSIEEEIVNYADLFYSKDSATLWRKRSVDEVRYSINHFAPQNSSLLEQWVEKFGA